MGAMLFIYVMWLLKATISVWPLRSVSETLDLTDTYVGDRAPIEENTQLSLQTCINDGGHTWYPIAGDGKIVTTGLLNNQGECRTSSLLLTK